MAWIESHTVLIRHRKVRELAKALNIKPVLAIGHLHTLWHSALEQQEDGDLSAWSDDWIAESAAYEGNSAQFVLELQDKKWLDGKILHDWLDYAGRYISTKYKTSNPIRLQEIYKKHSRSSKDCLKTPHLPNQHNLPNLQNTFNEIWKQYPNKAGKTKAFEKFAGSVKTEDDLRVIREALKRYLKHLQVNTWKQAQDGKTWFNSWRDWADFEDVKSGVKREKKPNPDCSACNGTGKLEKSNCWCWS